MDTRTGSRRPRSVDVIQDSRPRGIRVVVILGIMALTNMLNAVDRQVFPVLAPEVESHFGFSIGQTGLLTTVFTLGIGLFAIPAGMLGDRYRRKTILVVSIAIFSLATGLQAVATQFGDMLVYRVASGAGEGVQNAVLFAVAGAFLHRNRTMAIGVLTAAYGLGAAVAPLLGERLMGATGRWEIPLITLGLLGVVVLLLWIFIPASVTEPSDERAGTSPGTEHDDSPVTAARPSTPNVLVLGAVSMIIGFAIYGYLGLYPTYLADDRGFAASEAALAAGMFGVGGLSAIPLGTLADRWSPKLLTLIALAGMALVGPALFLAPEGLFVQVILSFLMGAFFTGVIYPNGMSLMQTSLPAHRISLAAGIFVTCLYVPSSFSGYVFGIVVDGRDWQFAGITLIGGLSLIALLLMCLYRPTRGSPDLSSGESTYAIHNVTVQTTNN